jgi:undecaprenyl diphosphate synthase
MDGNGRWASQRHLPVAAGHKAGVEKVRSVLESCQKNHINCLTLFAFSSENWQRPKLEVKALMSLFSSYLDNEVESLAQKNVRLRFIGRRDRFSSALIKKIEHAEKYTSQFNDLNLTLAVDYGGQWDIVEATRKIAEQIENHTLTAAEVTLEKVQSFMSIADLPTPDLLIRTSGEHRISNFLLWQLAYAELYFTDVLWPDFDENHFQDALASFAKRDRRFGGRKEAVSV